MIVLDRQTPKEIQMQIAQNVRAVRKRRKISQKALSEKSGVSLGSVKRFETSGEISLHALIKIAIALDMDDALIHLFEDVPFLSIEEIMNGQD